MIEDEIRFLNVDIDILSSFKLDTLLSFFEPQMVKMYCGEYKNGDFLLAMEHNEINFKKETPEQLINRICEVFENLPEEGKTLLKKVKSIKFDLGYNSGSTPSNLRNSLSNEVLKRIVNLNADLALTIYATEKTK